MSYLVETETSTEETQEYILYIQGKGGVKANPNSTHLFYKFTKLTSIEGLEYFDISNVTSMYAMFSDCSSLTTIDVSKWDVHNVTDMFEMFSGCSNLMTIIYGENFIKKEGANTTSMYHDCPANKPTHESWSSVTDW